MTTMILPVIVETYEEEHEEQICEPLTFDCGTHKGRKRVEKHLIWAINNGKIVVVYPKK